MQKTEPPAPKPNGAAADNPVWPDPLPLANPLPPVAPFDMDLLPRAFRPLVEDAAERMQVVPDFVALPLVVAFGAAVGRRVRIQPKAADSGFQVVPNLWGAIVAPPGYMKTPAIAAAVAPLVELEKESRSEYAAAYQNYEMEKELHDLDLSAWRQMATLARKRGAERPERPGRAPEPPGRTRYVTNDATIEALLVILAGNPAGVMNLRDELSGWLANLDKPGREGDRAVWLELWNGFGTYATDRIGRGSASADACASVMGGIQPGRLRSYLAEALRDGAGNDGLIQRFQVLAWPDLKREWKYVDRPPDGIALGAVADIFRRITLKSPAEPFTLKFDAEAQQLFVGWSEVLEDELRGDSLHPALVSHLAKYRSLMPSLAGLFELADNTESVHISLRHAEQAAAWCAPYLRSHAERMYSCFVSPTTVLAQDLASKIKAGKLGTTSFTLRDVYFKGWAGMDQAETARPVVGLLIDGHWLRSADPGRREKGGRPTDKYLINPKVFGVQRN
jgi:putative DNA primase/helicase